MKINWKLLSLSLILWNGGSIIKSWISNIQYDRNDLVINNSYSYQKKWSILVIRLKERKSKKEMLVEKEDISFD